MEDVDGPEVFGDVAIPEVLHPLRQTGRVPSLLEVRVVQALRGTEGNIPLHTLRRTIINKTHNFLLETT